MSDVVAVALITALASVPATITSYRVGKRNAEATVASAERQAEVELAKVSAENERLRERLRERQRRKREDWYHEMMTAAQRMPFVVETEADFIPTLHRWHTALAGVRIFGAPVVKNVVEPVQDHVAARPAPSVPGTPPDPTQHKAWSDQLVTMFSQLTDAMRMDVGSEE